MPPFNSYTLIKILWAAGLMVEKNLRKQASCRSILLAQKLKQGGCRNEPSAYTRIDALTALDNREDIRRQHLAGVVRSGLRCKSAGHGCGQGARRAYPQFT
ncbi:protein of unknown function [Burkholderia multivorans]